MCQGGPLVEPLVPTAAAAAAGAPSPLGTARKPRRRPLAPVTIALEAAPCADTDCGSGPAVDMEDCAGQCTNCKNGNGKKAAAPPAVVAPDPAVPAASAPEPAVPATSAPAPAAGGLAVEDLARPLLSVSPQPRSPRPADADRAGWSAMLERHTVLSPTEAAPADAAALPQCRTSSARASLASLDPAPVLQ